MTKLVPSLRRKKIKIAMVAVPAAAAQSVADLLVEAGVTAILNFAPAQFTVPEGVKVQNVDLSVLLKTLSYHTVRTTRSGSAANRASDAHLVVNCGRPARSPCAQYFTTQPPALTLQRGFAAPMARVFRAFPSHVAPRTIERYSCLVPLVVICTDGFVISMLIASSGVARARRTPAQVTDFETGCALGTPASRRGALIVPMLASRTNGSSREGLR